MELENKDLPEAIDGEKAMMNNQTQQKTQLDEPGDSVGLYDAIGRLAKDMNDMLMKQQDIESSVKTASEDIPFVTGQLSDLNRFTEEETHKILEFTETVLNNHDLLSAKLKSLETDIHFPDRSSFGDRLSEMNGLVKENKKVLMDILTGLSFQDLAGQRLKRMDVVLQELQARILKLVVAYGMEKRGEDMAVSKQRALLNELESSTGVKKMEQNQVNDILKEFGF